MMMIMMIIIIIIIIIIIMDLTKDMHYSIAHALSAIGKYRAFARCCALVFVTSSFFRTQSQGDALNPKKNN